MIYIAADHAGFSLKEHVKTMLAKHNQPVEDLGTATGDQEDDYPDHAAALAKKIQADLRAKGILVCGSGQGICIAANKFKGIRAAQAWTPELARVGRNDDDINVLCLAGGYQQTADVASIIDAFLNTPFEAAERRTRRLQKLARLEG